MYVALLSIHGLVRGTDLELGRDADTGGQILYVVELAQALARHPLISRVDLVTRRVNDPAVSADYACAEEPLADGARIVRIGAGPDEYIPKERLWDHLDSFADNLVAFFRQQPALPDIIHSHYADAGYVGSRVASLLGIPLVFTGHSLGRVKRNRFLAGGLSAREIEQRFNMSRRIAAEEMTLAAAERVITSTHQEITEQYELYDHYQPGQMRVIPPGTDLGQFTPPGEEELQGPLFERLARSLKDPHRPMILGLSRPDKRKNLGALIEAYGNSARLRDQANLVIVAGNRDDIDDLDEGAREVFHELLVAIDRHDLYGKAALPKHHLRAEVPGIYRIAAASGGIFVNPALTEPFGLTLIEAAASGLPIVATEDGGPQDIIGNCANGLLVDPLEPASIAAAMEKLLADRAFWEDCRDNGLQGVRTHYSWDAHAGRYLELMEPLVRQAEPLVRRPVQPRPGLYRDRALVSDLDQNLLGDDRALGELVAVLRRQRNTAYFVIATGRRLDSALRVMKKHGIPEPDILITSSGTEIYYAPELIADTVWARHIDHQWTPHKVREILRELPGLEPQPKQEQSRFKISYYIDPEQVDVETIRTLLHREEQAVHLQVAFGQFLDILPLRASKGMALRYVAELKGVPLAAVLVAGGSGADEEMMRGNTLAAVVANRHDEELSQLVDLDRIYFSSRPHAAGILEAIAYYDFFGRCRDPREIGPPP